MVESGPKQIYLKKKKKKNNPNAHKQEYQSQNVVYSYKETRHRNKKEWTGIPNNMDKSYKYVYWKKLERSGNMLCGSIYMKLKNRWN